MLDHTNRTLWRGEANIAIQPKVFDCIELLASRPGQLTSTSRIREALWPDATVGEDAVRQVITKARAALRVVGEPGPSIRSRKGIGYVLELAEQQTPSRLPRREARARPEPDWPIVGRQRELSELRQTLSNLADGAGEVWLISGGAGEGKSTLLQELARGYPHDDTLWLEGHCQEGLAAGAFWPFREIVHKLLSLGESDEALAADTKRIGDYWRAATKPFRGVIAAQERPSSAEQRLLVAQALCTQLCAVAARRPLVLVLEDLHWADAGTLLLLEILSRSTSGSALAIFATYRAAEASKHGALGSMLGRLAGRRGIRELHLGALTTSDLQALLSRAKPSHATLGAAESLMRLTGGNALFARMVVQQSHDLDDATQAASTQAQAHSVALPRMVLDLVRALPLPTQRLLPQAAVLGADFDLHVLAALVQGSLAQVQSEIEPALHAGIVVGASQGPYKQRFRHALVRDALYDDLSPHARMDLHRRAVAVYARLPAEQRSSSAIAWHAYLAGDAFDLQQTRALCEAAGRESFEQLAFDRALVHLERAIELNGHRTNGRPQAPLRPELELLYAQAHWEADVSPERIAAAFQRAVESAREAGSAEVLAEAAIGCAVGADSVTDLYAAPMRQEQYKWLEEAFGLLAPDQGLLKHRVARTLAWMSWPLGDVAAAKRWAGEALAYAAPTHDAWTRLHALGIACAHAMWVDDREAAIASLARMEAAVRELRLSARERAEGNLQLMSFALHIGDGACFRRAASDVPGNLARLPQPPRFGRLGQRFLAYTQLSSVVQVLLFTMDGNFAQAQALLGSMAAEVARYGIIPSAHDGDFALAMLLPVLLYQGRSQIVAPVLEFQKAAIGPLGYHICAAQMALERRDRATASIHFESLRNLGFGLPSKRGPARALLRHLVFMADLCAIVGNTADAAALYEELLPARDFCGSDRLTLSLGSCARPIGELSRMLGNHEQAVADFRQALRINEQLGHRPEIARTRLGLSRVLFTLGRAEEARTERDLGRADAERMGMKMPELELNQR